MSELLVAGLDDGHPRAETWLLNRPRVHNALNPDLVRAMHQALRRAEAADRRVVLLRGAGPSFCAGADLTFLGGHDPGLQETPRAFLEEIWDLTLAMERSPVVLVAALHGSVVAGGLELALACDVVLAAEGARIGDGHVRNNLVPGGGASARMERALGRGTAAWLGLTGELLPAADPGFAGWLRAVVPDDGLDAAARSTVERILAVHTPAQRRYKRLLHVNAAAPDEADKKAELDEFDRHWLEQDVPAALRTFRTRKRETR